MAAYKVRPGYRREVHYVESSPEDQLQPKSSSRFYAKPGDELDLDQPVLFDVEAKTQVEIVDNALFPNPYELSRLEWRTDSSAFTFEYNQRGHQVYRVIEVDAADRRGARRHQRGAEDVLHATPSKKYRYDVADGREVIWMSERDGWNHLYLYDGATGPGEEPDHEGRVGRPRRRRRWTRRSARSGSARAGCTRARTRTSSTTTASTSTAPASRA